MPTDNGIRKQLLLVKNTELKGQVCVQRGNVEDLTLTGSGDISATGNELDNVLTGNGGNNVLDGGTAADTMAGGAGNDTYVVDNVGDVAIENAGEGIDTILSSVSYVTPANVENLTLTGSANIDGTGNSLNNSLTGNSGNNRLDEGAGNDTMTGGTGNDTYLVDGLAGPKTIVNRPGLVGQYRSAARL